MHFCVQAKPGRILCRPGIWDTFGRKKCEKAFSACFFPWDTRCGFLSFFFADFGRCRWGEERSPANVCSFLKAEGPMEGKPCIS